MELDVVEWSGAVDDLGLELALEILAAWRRDRWRLIGAVVEGRLAEEQWWIFARSNASAEATMSAWTGWTLANGPPGAT
jgi:hypothetical protein